MYGWSEGLQDMILLINEKKSLYRRYQAENKILKVCDLQALRAIGLKSDVNL